MRDYNELDPSERVAFAEQRLEPLAKRLGGRLETVDSACVQVVGEAQPSGRAFQIVGDLDAEEGNGDVNLRVAVANHLGPVAFNHVASPSVPDGFQTHVRGNLYVAGTNKAEQRRGMEIVSGLPADFVALAEKFLRDYERFNLVLDADRLQTDCADLGFSDEDWDDCVKELEAELRGLDGLAQMIEAARPADSD